MIQIRHDVFETNSSSTHSITMCMKQDYDLWRKDFVWFIDRHDAKFLPWKELIEYIQKTHMVETEDIDALIKYHEEDNIEEIENILADYDIFSYSSWICNKKPELERFDRDFTTPDGNTVVSFGYYGADY